MAKVYENWKLASCNMTDLIKILIYLLNVDNYPDNQDEIFAVLNYMRGMSMDNRAETIRKCHEHYIKQIQDMKKWEKE